MLYIYLFLLEEGPTTALDFVDDTSIIAFGKTKKETAEG